MNSKFDMCDIKWRIPHKSHPFVPKHFYLRIAFNTYFKILIKYKWEIIGYALF